MFRKCVAASAAAAAAAAAARDVRLGGVCRFNAESVAARNQVRVASCSSWLLLLLCFFRLLLLLQLRLCNTVCVYVCVCLCGVHWLVLTMSAMHVPQAKSSAQRNIRAAIVEQYPVLEGAIDSLLPKKTPMFIVRSYVLCVRTRCGY